MNAWILFADPLCAKIFFKKDNRSPAVLYRKITRRKPKPTEIFLKYVAEEIDLACGAGTRNELIVLGKRPLVSRLVAKLGPEARSHLVHAISTA
jgi:hypothetical protein